MQPENIEAQRQVIGVYKDGEATINGRVYKLTKTTHLKRRQVFAFFSSTGGKLLIGDYSFFNDPGFIPVEKIINEMVLFDGHLIANLPDHWERYPEDYMQFIGAMSGAIVQPFLPGTVGD